MRERAGERVIERERWRERVRERSWRERVRERSWRERKAEPALSQCEWVCF